MVPLMQNDGVRPPGAPAARTIRNWEDAEENAVEWTRYLGFRDARRTPAGADGGLDIIGTGVAGQVKANMQGTISRDRIQALVGAAGRRQLQCVFYSLSLYSKPATEFAEAASVALFLFAYDGHVTPVSPAATRLFEAVGRPSRTHSTPRSPSHVEIVKAAKQFAVVAVLCFIACIACIVGYAGLGTHPRNTSGAVTWCVVTTLIAIGLLVGCAFTGRALWRSLTGPRPNTSP